MSGALDAFARSVTAASEREFAIWLIICSGAALAGFYYAFRFFRWRRMVEDVPTSKTRSAHQGYVALEGRGEMMDGAPIRTPMSQRDCVWWSLVEEQKTGDAWRTVNREVSDELFHLRDDTGTCIVDPEGAHVSTPHKRVTSGGRALPSRLRGVMHERRYTERFLVPEDRLYVIGRFRTIKGVDHWDHQTELVEKLRQWKHDQDTLLRRFDTDRDGRIDQEEWAAARRAARQEVAREHREESVQPGVNVLGQPEGARPFLIAADHHRSYSGKLRRKGLWATALFLVFATLTIALLGVRFQGA